MLRDGWRRQIEGLISARSVIYSPTATSVAQGSLAQISIGAIRCSFNARFRGSEVPESSGADAEVRFRKVPVQRLSQVPEGCGAEVRSSSESLRCRYPGQVPEGSGTEAR